MGVIEFCFQEKTQMPRWKKGESGNPGGRPSEARAELEKALDAAGKKRNPTTTFLKHVATKAYEDTGILKAVIDKFLPDLKSVDAKVSGGNGKPITVVFFGEKKVKSKVDDTKR